MADDKHLLVVFPTVFEPKGILQRAIRRDRFCRVEDITETSRCCDPLRQNTRACMPQNVAVCKSEAHFVEVLTSTAPIAVTITRDLGDEVDIDSVVKKKYRPIGVARALSHTMNLKQLLELRVMGVKLPEKECVSMKFGNLPNLHTLVLDAVGLQSLHPSVGHLANLQTLSLQHNMLYDLPFTLRLLCRLHTLDITGNFFSVLPGAIFHINSLENLIGVEKTDSQATAAGIESGKVGLPQEYTDSLAEIAVSHDLCENCNSAVMKLTPQQETTGYMLKVQMPEFCRVRSVPFYFMACSQRCRDTVDQVIRQTIAEQCLKLRQLEQTGVWLARHLYTVECWDIWEMRRRSRKGRGVDLNLRVDPTELRVNPNLTLINADLVAQVLGIETAPVIDMETPV